MMKTKKMTRKEFESFLFERFGALSSRKLRAEGDVCWFYYLNGFHVGTWTPKDSFVAGAPC